MHHCCSRFALQGLGFSRRERQKDLSGEAAPLTLNLRKGSVGPSNIARKQLDINNTYCISPTLEIFCSEGAGLADAVPHDDALETREMKFKERMYDKHLWTSCSKQGYLWSVRLIVCYALINHTLYRKDFS